MTGERFDESENRNYPILITEKDWRKIHRPSEIRGDIRHTPPTHPHDGNPRGREERSLPTLMKNINQHIRETPSKRDQYLDRYVTKSVSQSQREKAWKQHEKSDLSETMETRIELIYRKITGKITFVNQEFHIQQIYPSKMKIKGISRQPKTE